jgi:hypothetical protein
MAPGTTPVSLRGERRRRFSPRALFPVTVVVAFLIWNATFDYVVATAARQYLDAATSAGASGPYVLVETWMGPAIRRGLLSATIGAAGVLGAGFFLTALTARRQAH